MTIESCVCFSNLLCCILAQASALIETWKETEHRRQVGNETGDSLGSPLNLNHCFEARSQLEEYLPLHWQRQRPISREQPQWIHSGVGRQEAYFVDLKKSWHVKRASAMTVDQGGLNSQVSCQIQSSTLIRNDSATMTERIFLLESKKLEID